MRTERSDLVVIGAGQSGLATAFEARRAGIEPVVLDAADAPGGSWRRHYDSLALFSLLVLATGYRATFPFLESTRALAADGSPLHRGGVSTTMPGVGYVGLEFQRSFSSATIRGVARDARHVLAGLLAATREPARPEIGPPAVLRSSASLG